MNSRLPDCSIDRILVRDMFGHLSGDGMERAISEILRIARKEGWIRCFNAVNIEPHEINPFQEYHKNRIGIPQFGASLQKGGSSVGAILISAMSRRWGFHGRRV